MEDQSKIPNVVTLSREHAPIQENVRELVNALIFAADRGYFGDHFEDDPCAVPLRFREVVNSVTGEFSGLVREHGQTNVTRALLEVFAHEYCMNMDTHMGWNT